MTNLTSLLRQVQSNLILHIKSFCSIFILKKKMICDNFIQKDHSGSRGRKMTRLREWSNGGGSKVCTANKLFARFLARPKPTRRPIISHKDRDHVWMDCVLPTSVCTIDHLRPKSRIDCKIAATSSFQHVCARKTLNQS